MKNNYHTHTPRCNHAVGSEEEYVEKAIEYLESCNVKVEVVEK